MGDITKKEDAWLRRAIAAAVAEARTVVLNEQSLTNAQVGRLSDVEWTWIINAAVFGWIKTRVEQAIEEKFDQETAVRLIDHSPSPSDIAAVHSVLPILCDQAKVDWSKPLMGWSEEIMTNFLLVARQLIGQAEAARDWGAGEIVRKSEENNPTDTALPAAPVVPSDLSIGGVLALLLNFGRFSLKDLAGEMPDPLDLIDLAANLKDIADALKRSRTQKQAAKSEASRQSEEALT